MRHISRMIRILAYGIPAIAFLYFLFSFGSATLLIANWEPSTRALCTAIMLVGSIVITIAAWDDK